MLGIASLIFGEVGGAMELADVMVVSHHPRDQRIGTDLFRGPLGQITDHQAMVVGAGRLQHEATQQRMIGVAQFQELEGRGHAENCTQIHQSCPAKG